MFQGTGYPRDDHDVPTHAECEEINRRNAYIAQHPKRQTVVPQTEDEWDIFFDRFPVIFGGFVSAE